jgi:hypothetical protein
MLIFMKECQFIFKKKNYLDKKKVGRDDKNGKNLAWILAYVHAS